MTKDQNQKKDSGKLPLHLLPFDALTEVAKVLDFGAKKYAERGWEKGIDYSRVFGAIQRHTWAWFQGEDNDPETGLNHMAHATCECLFLLAFACRGRKDLDDRQKTVPRAEERRNYAAEVEKIRYIPPDLIAGVCDGCGPVR